MDKSLHVLPFTASFATFFTVACSLNHEGLIIGIGIDYRYTHGIEN